MTHLGAPGAGNAFAEHLGLRWDDPCCVRLTIRPDLINEIGVLLGPVGFAMVDYSMGSTLWSETAENELIATIGISIHFVQGARAGDVICRSRLDRRTRRVAVLSSEIRDEEGCLLATAGGDFSIFPASPRGV